MENIPNEFVDLAWKISMHSTDWFPLAVCAKAWRQVEDINNKLFS